MHFLVEPWELLPIADTLDEALSRINECETCGHTIRLIANELWSHETTGRYTCDLTSRYYGPEKLPLQFAKPKNKS